MLRVLFALLLLLAFWAALLISLKPTPPPWLAKLLPGALAAVQSARSITAKPVASRYFDVRNSSKASDAQLGFVIRTLEADYEAIHQLLGLPPTDRIPVLVSDGQGTAVTDGTRLNVFYDNGVLDITYAPFFLALQSGGEQIKLSGDLFYVILVVIFAAALAVSVVLLRRMRVAAVLRLGEQ